MGRGCRPFRAWKFRTMAPAAQVGRGAWDALDEHRITPLGRWLRRTRLDELPQLWNVLRGEMSLVGPRPCLPYEWEQYDEWHRRRFSVIPGCTGLWQVSGRSAVDYNDMVILDLFYIDNMSPLLDLKIIFRTIPVMLLAKGGY
jgi:lipopolysaccharide/colanic/teichoic acid biosynthesis glycosyltransferase